jgi:hypothetical protein
MDNQYIILLREATGMAPSSFGRKYAGDPRLISDMKRGRQLTQKTVDRISAAVYMDYPQLIVDRQER